MMLLMCYRWYQQQLGKEEDGDVSWLTWLMMNSREKWMKDGNWENRSAENHKQNWVK